MTRSRALIVVLLLGVVAPIGLGGLALPAYAQENDDSQSADEGDQSATATADNATDDSAKPPPAAKSAVASGTPPPAVNLFEGVGSMKTQADTNAATGSVLF